MGQWRVSSFAGKTGRCGILFHGAVDSLPLSQKWEGKGKEGVGTTAEELALRHWQSRAEWAENRMNTLEAALRKTDETAKRGKDGDASPAHYFNSIRRISRAALYGHRG
jgi:hypothetical protein